MTGSTDALVGLGMIWLGFSIVVAALFIATALDNIAAILRDKKP